jgi:excisionase family DNA binding protein
MLDTLKAQDVPEKELASLTALIDALPQDGRLADVLCHLVGVMRGGGEVLLAEKEMVLSPAQVAALLGMSRPHVYKLLDAGAIQHHRVGADRKVRMADLAEFMERRDQIRRELAVTLAHADSDRDSLVASIAGVDRSVARRLGY